MGSNKIPLFYISRLIMGIFRIKVAIKIRLTVKKVFLIVIGRMCLIEL